MRLEAVYDSLDDVPDALRDFYTEADDGTAMLDADVEAHPTISGLRNAYADEKRRRKELSKGRQKPSRQPSVPDGFSEERWQELLDIEQEHLDGKLTDAQKKEIEKRVNAVEERAKKAQQQLADENASLRKALDSEMITARAALAIGDKGSPKLLMPHMERQATVVQLDDGRFVARIVDDDGEVRYNDKGEPMTFDDLAVEMREQEEYAGAWFGTGSSGGGASRSTAGSGRSKTIAAGDNDAFIGHLDDIADGKVNVEM
jgi:hypothetical protein